MKNLPHLIPVKTCVLIPPQDNLFSALGKSLPPLKNGDILCVSSKVIAIHEGRCILDDGNIEKDELVKQETPYWLMRSSNKWSFMLTIMHNTLLGSAGIDQSNSNGYFTLLPKNPCESAKNIWEWLNKKYGLKNCAVIVTDSHSTPLKQGAMGVAIGAYGLKCMTDYRNTKDLFNRNFKMERANVPDTLAAAATGIMGEGAERTPAVIIRNWPNIEYTNKPDWENFVTTPENCVFWPLLKVFKKH